MTHSEQVLYNAFTYNFLKKSSPSCTKNTNAQVWTFYILDLHKLTTLLLQIDSEKVDIKKFLNDTKSKTVRPTSATVALATSRKIPTAELIGKSFARNSESGKSKYAGSKGLVTYESVLLKLYKSIRRLFPGVVSKKLLLNRCILLIGWERDRSLFMNQHELRHICYHKFGVDFNEHAIAVIFSSLDPSHAGVIRIRKFLGDIFRIASALSSDTAIESSLRASLIARNAEDSSVAVNALPTMTHNCDQVESGAPPTSTPVNADNTKNSDQHLDYPSMPLNVIEDMIYAKVADRNTQGRSLQQCVLYFFGDSRHRHRNDTLTLDQFMFTVRVRFQLPVNKSDVQKLFCKYDVSSAGTVDIRHFSHVLMHGRHQNEPIIDNAEHLRRLLQANSVFKDTTTIKNVLRDIRYATLVDVCC